VQTGDARTSAEKVPNGGDGERADSESWGGRGGSGGGSSGAGSRRLRRGGHDGDGGRRGEDPELEGGRHLANKLLGWSL
jgi:hypothetical protein